MTQVLQRCGLGSSLATSAAVHCLLLFGTLLGWNMARRPSSFPVDAIEIAMGDLLIQSGVSRRPQVAKAVTKEIASPLDLSVDKKKEKVQETPAEVEATDGHLGQGGETAASSGQVVSEWDSYRIRLRERIHEALIYPRASKNLGETGQVTVQLNVLRDGTISDIKVAEPSAFERLNVAAVDTVRRVARLDPFPPSYASNQYSALVPIQFTLK